MNKVAVRLGRGPRWPGDQNVAHRILFGDMEIRPVEDGSILQAIDDFNANVIHTIVIGKSHGGKKKDVSIERDGKDIFLVNGHKEAISCDLAGEIFAGICKVVAAVETSKTKSSIK